MSFLQNLKVAAGAGASEVNIVLEHAEHFRGGPVIGQVQVKGGELPQLAQTLELSIQEQWTQTTRRNGHTHSQTRTRVHSGVVVAKEFTVPAGGAFAWPFKLPIPRGGNLEHNWSVTARMSVPGAVDRHAETDLKPYPSPHMFALKEALCTLAPFRFAGAGALQNSLEAHFDIVPISDALSAHLDGVRIVSDAAMMGEVWSGRLEINPQEKSLADHFKAVVGANNITHPLNIPVNWLQPYRPPSPELMTQLRTHLQPYLGE